MSYSIKGPDRRTAGTVSLPSSKSISNRLLIIDALSGGRCTIDNLSRSDDTSLLVDALGSDEGVKDAGPAGTAMRFLTAYLAISPGQWELTGADRMKERPIGQLVDALSGLGADISYSGKTGYPPLVIRGRTLAGGHCRIDSSISSQFVSALLMIAPCMEKGLELELGKETVSSPYIRMTLGLMQQLGVEHRWEDRIISVPRQDYRPGRIRVEADWTAASYWYAVACLAGDAEILLKGLHLDSLQGDSVLPQLFAPLGVSTRESAAGITIRNTGGKTRRFTFDFTGNPDLVQTLAVACGLSGTAFRLEGTRSLRIKETDRIDALIAEMGKLGIGLTTDPEGSFIAWKGTGKGLPGMPVIRTYGDHRMAMAFAPAAWSLGRIVIEDPGVVVKSYPDFWKDLEALGCTISETG